MGMVKPNEAVELTCIRCPRGCALTAWPEGGEVTRVEGNSCKRGESYARAEVLAPVRTVTTTVPVLGSRAEKLVSAKTVPEVPKEKVADVMACARLLVARAPVAIGDVLCADIAGTGSDLVATKRA